MIYSLFIEIKGILPKPIINGELERLAERIRAKWDGSNIPRLQEIITAASLAEHGFLHSVERMILRYVDLASVLAEHMASLAACVTDRVAIIGVLNCDLINILDNIKCESCYIIEHILLAPFPVNYSDLYKAGNQHLMVAYATDILRLYISTSTS